MLVNQVLVALFLGIGYLVAPSTLFHDFPGPENGILKMVMPVDAGGILDHVWVVDITPVATVTDTGNIPGGVANGTGYELAEFNGFWHSGLLWIWTQKKATCRNDKPPSWCVNALYGYGVLSLLDATALGAVKYGFTNI